MLLQDISFKGKTGIITGGTQGIGLATAKQFAAMGGRAIVIGRGAAKGEAAVKEIGNARFYSMDLGDSDSIAGTFEQIIKDEGKIDVLINNAGIVNTDDFDKLDPKDWQKILDVDLTAVFLCCQIIFRHMAENGGGRIVNVASIAGIDGDMAQLEYIASKAALISATTRFAYELSDYGIRVNALAPGMTNTKMLGEMDDGVTISYMQHKTMRRKAEPSEIADVCLFLASEMSSYVNAQTIKVDGGGVNFVSTFNRK